MNFHDADETNDKHDAESDIDNLIARIRARRAKSAGRDSCDKDDPSAEPAFPPRAARRVAPHCPEEKMIAVAEIIAALDAEAQADESLAEACRGCRDKLLLAASVAESRPDPANAPRWRLRGVPSCKHDPAERDLRVQEILARARDMAAKAFAYWDRMPSSRTELRRQKIIASIAHLCANPQLLREISSAAQAAPGSCDGAPRLS